MGVPAAQARHGVDEMTPTVSFPTSSLKPRQVRVLKKAAAAKKPAACFSPKERNVRVVGGDNQCESQIAVGKNQLRRLNALGRMAPRTAHTTLLSARRLLRKPRLKTILEALRLYRTARVDLLGCEPAHFFDATKHDSNWLF